MSEIIDSHSGNNIPPEQLLLLLEERGFKVLSIGDLDIEESDYIQIYGLPYLLIPLDLFQYGYRIPSEIEEKLAWCKRIGIQNSQLYYGYCKQYPQPLADPDQPNYVIQHSALLGWKENPQDNKKVVFLLGEWQEAFHDLIDT